MNKQTLRAFNDVRDITKEVMDRMPSKSCIGGRVLSVLEERTLSYSLGHRTMAYLHFKKLEEKQPEPSSVPSV